MTDTVIHFRCQIQDEARRVWYVPFHTIQRRFGTCRLIRTLSDSPVLPHLAPLAIDRTARLQVNLWEEKEQHNATADRTVVVRGRVLCLQTSRAKERSKGSHTGKKVCLPAAEPFRMCVLTRWRCRRQRLTTLTEQSTKYVRECRCTLNHYAL